MDDAIGGTCPSCGGEFHPGVTECPDCGVPLVGPGEEAPASEAEVVQDDPWGVRLDVVASVASGAIIVYFLACAIAA